MAGPLSSLVARSRIYIGGTVSQGTVHRPGGLTASDFAGQEWLLIEQPENLGRLATRGVEAEHQMTRSGPPRRPRAKIGRAVEDMTLTFSLAVHKPGQAALLEAEVDGKARAFKIVLADAPAGGFPSERLFIAVVGSVGESFGGPEDQPRLLVDLWLSGEAVRIHAAEGVAP